MTSNVNIRSYNAIICVASAHPVTMKFNTASMSAPVIIGLDLRRSADQRCETPFKSGLANRNQAKSLEFRHFR